MTSKEKAKFVINWNVLMTSIATAMILGFFAYITNTQNQLQQSISDMIVDEKVTAEQLNAVRSSLTEIKDGMADRYTARDAHEDQEELNERITVLAQNQGKQISAIEARVREVERIVDRTRLNE